MIPWRQLKCTWSKRKLILCFHARLWAVYPQATLSSLSLHERQLQPAICLLILPVWQQAPVSIFMGTFKLQGTQYKFFLNGKCSKGLPHQNLMHWVRLKMSASWKYPIWEGDLVCLHLQTKSQGAPLTWLVGRARLSFLCIPPRDSTVLSFHSLSLSPGTPGFCLYRMGGEGEKEKEVPVWSYLRKALRVSLWLPFRTWRYLLTERFSMVNSHHGRLLEWIQIHTVKKVF